MTELHGPDEEPVRVCPRCSTQSRTAGNYCPHCGASFVRRRRFRRKTKIVVATLLGLVILGGAGAAAAVKIQHDNDVKAEKDRKEAEAARIAREREEAEQEAAKERQREQEAQEALDRIEREGRRDLERALRKAITKDAEAKVSAGLLDGPILETVCDPVGGGREDLSSRTGKYDCLAVTEIDDDGTQSGYSFHATINYKEFSYSWGLGRD